MAILSEPGHRTDGDHAQPVDSRVPPAPDGWRDEKAAEIFMLFLNRWFTDDYRTDDDVDDDDYRAVAKNIARNAYTFVDELWRARFASPVSAATARLRRRLSR